jgi:hypothetical protein
MIEKILIYSVLTLILLGAAQMLVLDRWLNKDVARLIAFKKAVRWVMYGLTGMVAGSMGWLFGKRKK